MKKVLAIYLFLSVSACSNEEPAVGDTRDASNPSDASNSPDGGDRSDVGPSMDVATGPDLDTTDVGADLPVSDADPADMPDNPDAGCPPGFVPSGGAAPCMDVDECADQTDNCDANATCTNVDGSFTCACNAGFNGDGVTCTDTGDCANDPCADAGDANSTCTEGATGYTCACSAGYSFDGATCSDTDECVGNPCDDAQDTAATCTDEAAPATGYVCSCSVGFVSDGVTCNPMPSNAMSFFVSSSSPSPNGDGNLGGIAGADAHCQALALAANPNDTRTWVAYLSAEGAAGTADDIHARDRIGTGPWFNANGDMFAADLDALHTIETAIIACNPGPATCLQDRADYVALKPADSLFLDENGVQITDPLQPEHLPLPSGDDRGHDIFTGSRPDGTLLPGATCGDWTSASQNDFAQVGHTDTPNNTAFSPSWNSAHETVSCTQNGVRQRGGAGFVYCFTPD